jgi:hypothetical protein
MTEMLNYSFNLIDSYLITTEDYLKGSDILCGNVTVLSKFIHIYIPHIEVISFKYPTNIFHIIYL